MEERRLLAYLAERLVELDLAIEDLDAWATEPDDVEELQRLERLRDDLRAVLTGPRIPHHLRKQLAERLSGTDAISPATFDARD